VRSREERLVAGTRFDYRCGSTQRNVHADSSLLGLLCRLTIDNAAKMVAVSSCSPQSWSLEFAFRWCSERTPPTLGNEDIAHFRINRSFAARDSKHSLFDVSWFGNPARIGDHFTVREAGHVWPVTVVSIEPRDGGAVLECDIPLGYPMQCAPSEVNTEAQPPELTFRYLRVNHDY
jgi:hypothetical protein